jgi:hypothetical protein
MPNLVGTGLNQVPTNSMLGGMAYQDPEHASIKNLDLKNLSQINSEIADTAVDVFVYDTRKDSDGGAWRKRTQNTSWYNETLNTSDRGSRKEFPAVAVIVATADDIIIYDGDDPDLPMWMIFESPNTGTPYDTHYLGRGSGFSGFSPDITSVAILNGILVVGKDGDSTNYAESYTEIRFISDRALHRDQTSASDMGNAISGRNGSAGGRISNSSYGGLAHFDLHDVAMTVLPNAPVDSATGLPIPTIAVGTEGGVSVIKDDGTVVDVIHTAFKNITQIFFTEDNLLAYLAAGTINQTYGFHYIKIPSGDLNNGTDGREVGTHDVRFYNGDGRNYIPSLGAKAYGHNFIDGAIGYSDASIGGLTLLETNAPTNYANSSIAFVNTDYNTGWMHGDCKGAFLSDTSTVSMPELVTNGTFDSNTNGWTAYHAVASVDNNRLKIDDSANSGGWSSVVHQVATVIGKTYQFTFTYTFSSDSFLAGHYAGSYASAGAGTQPTSFTDYGTTSGTYTRIITATTTTTSLVLSVNNAGVSFVDNVSFKLLEEDRSVNNNGLTVYGTITKSAVATGADLVGYSGFTASNYLRYDASNMNFGTGDFSVSLWCIPSTDASNEFILELDDASSSSNNRFYFLTTNTSTKRLYLPWDSDIAGSELSPGQWNHIVVGRKSGYGFVYVNSRWIADGYKAYTMDLEGNGFGTISNYSAGPSNDYAWSGSLALLRISGSAPSAEQIKKMYEDEKVLFQENAKATLYGSSDAVTALAYDDTTNLLHVGTSAGRSEFQGLRRINNTTDAVTTAISASNGLVAEQ